MSDVVVRRAHERELPDILTLAAAALGWRDGEPNEALFRWKHRENPFGSSPMWVAEVDGRLAGFRTFVRWQWERDLEPRIAHAVRAVDTATHPDFQGRGIFTKLTLAAIDELADEGIDFVFNTPNAQSRPGYVKMGWKVVGRLPVRVRLCGPSAAARMLTSRVPADKWSIESEAGATPSVAFANAAALGSLLASQPPVRGLRTCRSVGFLRWRYGLEPLGYRVLLATEDAVDGLLIFRLRMRGGAVEAVVDDVIVPEARPDVERRLVRELARRSGADYLIRIDHRRFPPGGFAPLPNQGPILTWRAVTESTMPTLPEWDVRLGDIELF
jgi:GNAT superfamily N-acetyltransferase